MKIFSPFVKRWLFRFFSLSIFWMLSMDATWAANGKICEPSGFASFTPLSPNVINLKQGITSDTLLATETVTDTIASPCLSDRTAELSYLFLPNSLFVNSDPGFFTAAVNLIQNTPTTIKVGYSLRTIVGDTFSNPHSAYSMYVNYYITVSCAGGGLSYYSPSNDEFRIRGINSAACNGNYAVTNKYEIYQNRMAFLKSGYQSATTGTGFRVRVSLYKDSVILQPTFTIITGIAPTYSTVFQLNLSCTYSVTPNTINLGNFTNVNVYLAYVSAFNFSVNALNCTNPSGAGVSHKLFVVWNFEVVDPLDPTILGNSSTGPNAATNVGLALACNNAAVVNNALSLLSSSITASNVFPCYVFMIPTSNVTSPNQIRAGNFVGRATLTFTLN